MAPWRTKKGQEKVGFLSGVCLLAAHGLVTTWVAAWLVNQPAGQPAADWLALVLRRRLAGLLAGLRTNLWRGSLTG